MPTGATSAPRSALWEVSPKDEQGNVLSGDAWVHNSENCYINSDEKLVAAIGVENPVIVSTKDAVLVMNRERSRGREEGRSSSLSRTSAASTSATARFTVPGAAATWWSRPRASTSTVSP